jgi:hypothetical protein
VLLCGCGADDATVSYVYEYEYVPKQLIAERIDFEDIEYIRPDMDALYELVFALEDALQSRHNLEEICSLIDYFNAGCTSFATMYSVANIRACMDLTDEFYDEELSWCMAAEAELQMLMDELYLACANSEYAQWLEENVFWDGFCEEYRLADDGGCGDLAVGYVVGQPLCHKASLAWVTALFDINDPVRDYVTAVGKGQRIVYFLLTGVHVNNVDQRAHVVLGLHRAG